MTPTPKRAAVLVLGAALAVSACSGSEPDAASPTTTSTTATVPAGQPSAAPTTAPESTNPSTAGSDTTAVPDPPPIGETAFGRAQAMLLDETATDLDRALTEFALHFGSVPGSADIQPDGSEPGTVTGALAAIDAVFDELAPEQQSAVLERLRPLFDGAFAPRRGFVRSGPTPLQAEFQALADQMAERLMSEIGGTPLDFELLFTDDDPAAGDMVTSFGFGTMSRQQIVDWLERLVGSYSVPTSDCAIVIGPSGLSRMGAERVSAIAHEMFHCWSIMNSSSTAAHDRTPSWYQEGVASWVGEEIAGGSAYSTNWWAYYLDGSRFALAPGMKYPAIGFWSWIDSRGTDLWSLIPALQAAAGTGDQQSVFNIATASMDAETASTWSSARVRAADWGAAWDMDGPGIGDRSHRTPTIAIPVGGTRVFETSALGVHNVFTDPLDAVDVGADHLAGISLQASGTWRLRWDSGDEISNVTGPSRLAWCSARPCVCPDGSTPVGFPDEAPGSGELAVALTGTGTAIGSLSLSVNELCDDVEPPTDPGDASPAGLAGTWTATHDALNRFAEHIYADVDGTEVLGTAGGATMTFDGAGQGTLQYDNLRLAVEVTGVTTDVGVTGGGSFGYVLQGTTMIVSGTDMALTFDIFGQPLEMTGDDVPLGGESRYTWSLDGDRLVLQQHSSNAPLPNEWRRAG